MDDKYKLQLQIESENLDPSFEHAARLVSQELERLESGAPPTSSAQSQSTDTAGQLLQVHVDKPIKLSAKVKIPVKEHPKFNFVGKLLGPQGNSLKRLQHETGTKMSILGRGSMRDKAKEEECRKEGGKYAHLNDELHVLIEVFTDVADAYARISHGLTELKKFLIPEHNDDIGEQQRQEMMFLNGGYQERAPPGGPPPPRGRGRGRGGPPPPRGRGGVGGLLATPGGRGIRQGGPGGFSGVARGARGLPSQGLSRGSARGVAPRGGMRPPAPPPAPAPIPAESYDDYSGGYDDAYADQGYGDGYDQSYGAQASDTQYFDYGHGAQTDSYDDGYGDAQWGSTVPAMKAPVSRGRGQYRSHPYVGGGRGVAY
ncbi:KH domain-containing, RNA-binding, signal transduction-associated protein 3-like [Liolophura sinensis]|uniref:KH domain-containing, RNA-binding, signal transduction-associated protein 3-like n=1 Tax=Liolophura sinensis TaxID=3198878 RepID=UPI003158468E